MYKNYIKLNRILCAILLLAGTQSFGQSFTWVKNAGDNDKFTWGQGVAIDRQHNEVVCGYQAGDTHFGSTIAPFAGDFDAYLAKYDSSGNVLWVRTIWGPNTEKAYHVALDTFDNIYVVGQFNSPFSHLSATDSIAIIAGGGNRNFFIAKYDKNGNFLWAQKGGNAVTGTKDCNAYAVTVDPSGNAVVGGFYQGSMTIAGTPLTGGAQNLFLAKYSPTGTCLWSKAIQANSMCWVSDIACDSAGNIYPAGKFGDTLKVGGVPVASNIMGDAAFFGKFNSSGVMQWVKAMPNNEASSTSDNNFNSGNSIIVDNSGNVYVAGSLLDTVILVPGPSLYIEQSGFIAKYNSSGVQTWMQKFGKHKRDVVNGIAFDAAGGLYAVGNYSGSTTIGGMAVTPPSWGYGNIFVGKFDPATGNAVWIKTGGGLPVSVNLDMALDIAVDQKNGNIATTGFFEHQIRFESIITTSASTALSYQDMYLARQFNPVFVSTPPPPPPTGVATVAADQYIMYPNPTSGIVTVDLSGAAYHRIVVVDVAGNIVKEMEATTTTCSVDIRGLAAGTYTIGVSDNQTILWKKLVKM
jgi:hypothetical protein